MRIIISPAKKMNIDTNSLAPLNMPVFLKQAKQIMEELRGKSLEDLQNLWKCNKNLAQMNYERLLHMELSHGLTPALLSYEGIQYHYIAPTIFEDQMLTYVEEHLRILSGFYGVLHPMDGIVPYRLEMQAKLPIDPHPNLYAFWGSQLYAEVRDESGIFINLASKEYSRCVESYLQPEDTFITCVFGELINDKVVQKGTYAKMARGEMVRYMAQNQIYTADQVKDFNGLGYQYEPSFSTQCDYTFLKKV